MVVVVVVVVVAVVVVIAVVVVAVVGALMGLVKGQAYWTKSRRGRLLLLLGLSLGLVPLQ